MHTGLRASPPEPQRLGATAAAARSPALTHRRRALRSDAAANRERVLDAAAVAVRREGEKVAIATIDAGVGVGTLYRHFPTREALLAAISQRSFRLALGHASRAAERGGPAIAAVGSFFEGVIADRDDLVLPLHGGPVSLDEVTGSLRAEIRTTLESILLRGREDRTIRSDVTALDLIVTGALLSQPLPHVSEWDRVARRQMGIYLTGLAVTSAQGLGRLG